MASPTSTAARAQQPADLLRQARARVLAAIDDSVPAPPAAVTSDQPLRPLPPDVAALVERRVQHGLRPTGEDFDRHRWFTAARVAAVLTGPALAATVVGLLGGNGTLATSAAIATAVLAAVAIGSSWHAAADPLYLGPRERREIAAAGRWSPTRALRPGRPAAVLTQATTAASRIVTSPAWRDGRLVDAGVALPLGPELDRIEQAGDSDLAIARVVTLAAYADVVERLAGELEAEDVEILCFLLSGEAHHICPD